MCGTGINAAEMSAAPSRSALVPAPWIVAGVAVVGLIGVLVIPRLTAEPEVAAAFAPSMPSPTGPAPGAQSVDLSSMTPREAADRLFDRIMRSASLGDSAEARQFVPMALGAYERVEELDHDARYHLGVLHLLLGDAAAARAEADLILADDPNHLFGLITAAQAADQMGRTDEARALFQRFLELYPSEIARDLPEYSAHAPALPEMRAEAQSYAR